MAWFLIIEFFLLVTSVLLYKLDKFKVCGLFVLLLILVPAGITGAFIGGSLGNHVTSYVVYGSERVHSENIKLTGYEDRMCIFSNGEKIPRPKSIFIEASTGLGFLVGSAIPLFAGLFVVKKITHKFAPEVYELLKPKPMQVKNPFKHGEN